MTIPSRYHVPSLKDSCKMLHKLLRILVIHKIMLKLAVYTSTLGEGIRCWLLHRVGLQQRGPGRVHGSHQCQG